MFKGLKIGRLIASIALGIVDNMPFWKRFLLAKMSKQKGIGTVDKVRVVTSFIALAAFLFGAASHLDNDTIDFIIQFLESIKGIG